MNGVLYFAFVFCVSHGLSLSSLHEGFGRLASEKILTTCESPLENL